MTDRPIIFSAPMVRALLDGRKTQTRRLATSPLRKCEVGDRLFVRENCRAIELDSGLDCFEFQATMDREDDEIPIEDTLEASDLWGKLRQYGRRKNGPLIAAIARNAGGIAGPWVPSIHMPRSISRLTLIVESVKVEGGTCDAPICPRCTTSPAPDKDLCPTHAAAFATWKSQRSDDVRPLL